jgi:hypothetical protein
MKWNNWVLYSMLFLVSHSLRVLASYPRYCIEDPVEGLVENIYDSCIPEIGSSECNNALHACKNCNVHDCCACFGPVLWTMCKLS